MNKKSRDHIIIFMIFIGLIFTSQLSIKTHADTNQIPTVSITSPNEGETISGQITITGTAYDPDGTIQLVLVRFDVHHEGGMANGTTNWSYIWDTTTISDGVHTIYARSYDGEYNSNIESINIIVNNNVENENQIPIITIDQPLEGSTISGKTTISGSADDIDGSIEKVEIKINAEQWNIVTGTTNWSFIFDTTLVDNGIHTIYARSYDGQNYSMTKSINIILNNDNENGNQIPIISIISPKNNEIISGELIIKGTSSDSNEVIKKVEIRINTGSWILASGTLNWSYNWDTTKINDGKHTIYARNFNGEKYSNIISINVIINNIVGDENQIPSIKITHPLTGDTISGIRNVYGISTDSDGLIQYVQIKINSGLWINTTGEELWSYTWDTTNETAGEHIIYARSYDGQDYSEIVSIIVTVNNKSIPGFDLLVFLIGITIFIIILKKKFN